MDIVRLPDGLKKQPKESDSAHSALIHFYELGPGRSLSSLHELFLDQSKEGIAVPTESYYTLGAWSSKHGWNARIESVQQAQYAVEIEALHAARVKFVRKQVDMLELWEKMLIMGQPDLEDVSFDKWSRSAKDFVSAIGQVFGLENREVNVNVRDNRKPEDVDVDAATSELMGIIESVRERAQLESFEGDQGIIDIEGRPIQRQGAGE